MLSAGGRRPGRPRFRPVTAPNPYRSFPGHNPLRALWVLPVIAGAVLALLVALLTARVGYAGTVLTGVFCSREWTPADEPLAAGADLGYTTKNYVRLAVYSAEPLQSLRVGTLSLPVAVLDKDYSVEGAVYRYPAEGRDAVALLRPGKNTVTVSARGARLTESLKFSVTYVAAPVEGAEYYVADVGALRQVTAFDKALQFSTPAGTVILDGSVPAADQSMRWVVYDPPEDQEDLPTGFRPVGKVFGLLPGDYVLSSQPTLTLKYDPAVSPTTAAQVLTVFAADHPYDFDDAENLGGVVNSRAGTITVKLDRDCGGKYYCVFLGIQNFEEFMGVGDVAWSYAYVMPLWARGIMEPYFDDPGLTDECLWDYGLPEPGSFGLVDAGGEEVEVCRGEFTVMMAKAMGYRPVMSVEEGDEPEDYEPRLSFWDLYDDLTGDDDGETLDNLRRYGVWIETAARYGLVNGFPSEDENEPRPEFRMKEGLPREQAAAILVRAAGLAVSDDTGAVDDALAKAFVDANDISSWARPYVLAAYRAKYIEGVPETGADGKTTYKFEPERELTRAEAAKLVYFVAKKNGKL